MASTARMILVVEPAEKARWEKEAKKAGISTAEFLRRAAAVYDSEFTPDEMLMLEAAAKEMNASVGRMVATLDATLAVMRDANDPDRDARLKAKVMAELEGKPVLDLARLRDFAA
jgi:hypothetical protein